MTLNYIRIVGVLSEKGNYIPSHQLEAEKSKNHVESIILHRTTRVNH